MRRCNQNCGCLPISDSGWDEADSPSQSSMSGSSRGSLQTNGEKAESIEAIRKRSGSFWIIFESVTLFPA